MTLLLLCLAVVMTAVAWRASRVPLKHRWRQGQARIMCDAIRGRDRTQPPALIYARLRYTGDGGVDGQVVIDGCVWMIQSKRYASAIRPEDARAFSSLCTVWGLPGLFIHTGRTSDTSRDAIDRHAAIEIVSGQRLVALIIGGALSIGRSAL